MNIGNKKEYYSIGDVAEITGVKPTVLRFWEQEFSQIMPVKNKFGHRVYREKDIEIILKIKKLLYEEGLTIKGAKNILNESKNENKIDVKIIKNKIEELLRLLDERKNQ
ncbi:MAG: hypothetical protein A2086_12570 [Spirochaetes bacterium GWD1_27_9]|nr:MAG: hypothetical protein A2Z98_10885 [Spirochaetes bacterium GWB1_27_13]OHD23464.1 MAG: hypothetical protein A2Y34_14125 [Spirochaetes bacterium GWC1_27_15]OHD44292.1 MAG: hypothetical protein A2086_12570 [Spirochaetes bacterium GWD1_27_9]